MKVCRSILAALLVLVSSGVVGQTGCGHRTSYLAEDHFGGTDEAEFIRMLREAAMADTVSPRPERIQRTARLALEAVSVLAYKAPMSLILGTK